jgi:hypothetical protein
MCLKAPIHLTLIPRQTDSLKHVDVSVKEAKTDLDPQKVG